jgi:hypothetical protein
MTVRRLAIPVLAMAVAVLAGLQVWTFVQTARTPAAEASPPAAPPIDAAQIATGHLSMERLPREVGDALEMQSGEIVKTAEALQGKQARISGTCAPGSAIRVIAENGTVSCQHLPRGVLSVTSLTAIPILATTETAVATVTGGVGRYQVGGEDDFLVAPVALPDGAIVTGFSFACFDDAPDVDGAALLYRSDGQQLAEAATSGAANEVRVTSTEQIELKKVDASRYAYFVYFPISARARAAFLPISASITYRLP